MNEKKDKKVVNLHYTTICNYRCRFCFARFGCTPLKFEDRKKIIDNISGDMNIDHFKLAGCEPMATPYVQNMIDYIHSLGIKCSIITNGSLLTKEFIRKNRNKLSLIGISVDSVSHQDNQKLDRIDGAGRTLSFKKTAISGF